MPYFPVVLDSSVLAPAWIRDVLLSLAAQELYEPLWTCGILSEAVEALRGEGFPDPTGDRVIEVLKSTFDRSLVDDYAHLRPVMQCSDEVSHVLAAGVGHSAAVVVTNRVQSFPLASEMPYDIDIKTADDFARGIFFFSPRKAIDAIEFLAVSLPLTHRTAPELLEHLKDPQMFPKFALTACQYVSLHGWKSQIDEDMTQWRLGLGPAPDD